MRNILSPLGLIVLLAMVVSCGGGGQSLPERLEVKLTPVKGVTAAATGTAVIDTKTGTDITLAVSGLEPAKLYTVYFINVKSQMFEGIGPAPHILKVEPNGEATLKTTMKKDVYKQFVNIGVFLNPGDKPIGNPLGVKQALGSLVKQELPKQILEGKLR